MVFFSTAQMPQSCLASALEDQRLRSRTSYFCIVIIYIIFSADFSLLFVQIQWLGSALTRQQQLVIGALA